MKENPPSREKHRGVVVPMISPFTDHFELDEAAACRVIDHLIEGGMEGVFVLGTTGEAASMTPAMRKQLVRTAVEHTAGRALVYAGIGDNCLSNSLESAHEFLRLGVDAVVAHPPSYYPLIGEEMRDYFRALADNLPQSLVLYNIPPTTHLSIPLEVVEELSGHPNIIGFKDSENDPDRLREVLLRMGGRPDFSIFVGCAKHSQLGLSLGADGLVPSSANIAPEPCRNLYANAQKGNWDAVGEAQEEMDRTGNLYQRGRTLGQSLAAMKAVMKTLGLCGETVLPPLRSLSGEEQAALRPRWEEVGI